MVRFLLVHFVSYTKLNYVKLIYSSIRLLVQTLFSEGYQWNSNWKEAAAIMFPNAQCTARLRELGSRVRPKAAGTSFFYGRNRNGTGKLDSSGCAIVSLVVGCKWLFFTTNDL
jgi:hypothetical protein